MKQFRAMVKARTMEFIRDKGTFYWNLLFPIVLVVGFSIAFSGERDTLFKVGLIDSQTENRQEEFFSLEQIDFIPYDSEREDFSREDLIHKVRLHQLDMLLDFPRNSFYINPGSVNADLLNYLLDKSEESSAVTGTSMNLVQKEVEGKAIRYVDWLVPGVIGMNMLFSCLFGVGFVIVRYRKNGVLKRLKATPVSALSFISAQMASRFIIVILTSVFVFTGTNLFLKFLMLGSYLNLLLITALSILCMISIGLVFASRIKSEELAGGLINLITFPMIIFSGVFFSMEGTPHYLQTLSRIFPLTHFINGARRIMLEGAGLVEILPQLAALTGMTILFGLIAAFSFSWD